MQGGGHRHPGPFPAQWMGWLSSPLHQRSSPNIWGEEQARLGRSHLGCLRASQRDGEALREARMAPCLPEPSCLHAKAADRRPRVHQVSSTPSRQDMSKSNQTKVEMVSPAFQQRGSEKARMWTESPGKPRSHPTTHPKSHTYSNNTPYCPGLKQKPNHKPDTRSRLRRTTCALQAAGLAPKPTLEDSCQ